MTARRSISMTCNAEVNICVSAVRPGRSASDSMSFAARSRASLTSVASMRASPVSSWLRTACKAMTSADSPAISRSQSIGLPEQKSGEIDDEDQQRQRRKDGDELGLERLWWRRFRLDLLVLHGPSLLGCRS